eukprot:1141220-Pelagomonas_calceolata.AAC.4
MGRSKVISLHPAGSLLAECTSCKHRRSFKRRPDARQMLSVACGHLKDLLLLLLVLLLALVLFPVLHLSCCLSCSFSAANFHPQQAAGPQHACTNALTCYAHLALPCCTGVPCALSRRPWQIPWRQLQLWGAVSPSLPGSSCGSTRPLRL